MARLNFAGVETRSLSEFTTSGTVSAVTTPVRTGTHALRANPTTTAAGYGQLGTLNVFGLQVTDVDAGAVTYLAFYFQYATKPAANSEEIAAFYDTVAALKLAVRIDSAGNLMAFAADGTTQLGSTGATTLSANTWYLIEASAATGASAAWEIKIDGTSEISGTGSLGTRDAASVRVGKVTNRNGNTVDFFYDDIRWDGAAFPGAGQITRMDMDGDGAYVTWTVGAGAGADWTNVDDLNSAAHDDDTTYLLSTLTDGNASTASLVTGAAAGITGTVKSVMNSGFFKRDGANAGMTIRLRSGSTDNDTASIYVPTTAYVLLRKLYNTDPATAAAWVLSALDSVEVGAVEKDTGTRSRWTAGGLMVEYVPAVSTVVGFGLSAIAAGEVHGGGGFVNQGLHQIDMGICA